MNTAPYNLDDPLAGLDDYPYVWVRFKGTRMEPYKVPRRMHRVRINQLVVVDVGTGWDIGTVALTGFLARKRPPDREDIPEILRYPTPKDMEIFARARKREKEMFAKVRKVLKDEYSWIKLIDVEMRADGQGMYVYLKSLTEERINIPVVSSWLSQITGIRVHVQVLSDRKAAGFTGGIGVCGRTLCCATWLREPPYVPSSSLENQTLYFNPEKVVGLCGKLKCCFNYELDFYLEGIASVPKIKEITTKKGKAIFWRADLIQKKLFFKYEDETVLELTYGNAVRLYDMNQRGEIPDEP